MNQGLVYRLFAAVTWGIRSTLLTGRGEVESDGVVEDGTELEQPVKIEVSMDGRTDKQREDWKDLAGYPTTLLPA